MKRMQVIALVAILQPAKIVKQHLILVHHVKLINFCFKINVKANALNNTINPMGNA